MTMRPAMAEILPPAQEGEATVEHFTVTEDGAKFASLRALISGDPYAEVEAGKYVRLVIDGHGLMMSDTDMEWRTNREFMRRAHGRVLVGGLGLAFTLLPVLAKPEVEKVTVIEKYRSVTKLVLPHIKDQPGFEKLRVIVSDVLTWEPPQRAKWEVIYFDIWPSICGDNVKEMTRLKRRFARRLNRDDPNAWMACWREDDARRGR